MNIPEINFQRILTASLEEASLIRNTIKDKGARFFMRPLAVALALVGGCYVLVLQPSRQQLTRLDRKLTTARSTARFADGYKESHDRLAGIYRELPAPQDRDQWLFTSLIDSLKSSNITSESLKPPSDEESSGVIYQNVSMSSKLKFQTIYSWILTMESLRPAVQITGLDISKLKEDLGYTQTSCTIGTAIPVRRY